MHADQLTVPAAMVRTLVDESGTGHDHGQMVAGAWRAKSETSHDHGGMVAGTAKSP
jgi:hypothetical protein